MVLLELISDRVVAEDLAPVWFEGHGGLLYGRGLSQSGQEEM